MRRSISRCGWRSPTGAACTMPGWSTRCCAASPARARSASPGLDTIALDTPDWLMARWLRNYGAETARAIAAANGREPALDLTVKGADAEHWAQALGGRVLATGSVRATVHGPVSSLPGYDDGAWWVQDAAAALPARLLGDISGRSVADLCAAPGGKTAQLAAAGARVTAVDRAPARLDRLRQNLARLALTAETVVADVAQWRGGTVRRGPARCALLVDRDHPPPSGHPLAQARRRHRGAGGTAAPAACARGRADQAGRHPGLLHLLARAGGGDRGRARRCSSATRGLRRRPIAAAEVGGLAELVSPDGDLRTLPCHLADPDSRMAGLDGFYAARLVRI